jgi:hypothetical protein
VASHCVAREGRTFQSATAIASGLNFQVRSEFGAQYEEQNPSPEHLNRRTQNDVRDA